MRTRYWRSRRHRHSGRVLMRTCRRTRGRHRWMDVRLRRSSWRRRLSRHRHPRCVLMRACCRGSGGHRHAGHVLMGTCCRRGRRHWHPRNVLMRSWRRRRLWRSWLACGTPWFSSRRAFPRRLFRRRRFVHGVVVLRVNYRAAHKEQRYPQHPNNSEFPVSNNSVHDQSLLPLLR